MDFDIEQSIKLLVNNKPEVYCKGYLWEDLGNDCLQPVKACPKEVTKLRKGTRLRASGNIYELAG